MLSKLINNVSAYKKMYFFLTKSAITSLLHQMKDVRNCLSALIYSSILSIVLKYIITLIFRIHQSEIHIIHFKLITDLVYNYDSNSFEVKV